jgi:hypothetical protein
MMHLEEQDGFVDRAMWAAEQRGYWFVILFSQPSASAVPPLATMTAKITPYLSPSITCITIFAVSTRRCGLPRQWLLA